jgi:hypothetical protein
MTIEENDEALVVEIYAQQFNWKARYSGDDGVLGDANVRFLQEFGGKNLVGIDPTDPNGEDDVVVQELHLPVDRQVVFRIRSQDVLHSMYMPHFRAQMNAVPGMINQFAFTPNVTTKEMRLKKEVVDKVKKIQKEQVVAKTIETKPAEETNSEQQAVAEAQAAAEAEAQAQAAAEAAEAQAVAAKAAAEAQAAEAQAAAAKAAAEAQAKAAAEARAAEKEINYLKIALYIILLLAVLSGALLCV